MLSLLLGARHEDGSPMSAQELRDELMTLLVAGHETTASQLAFAFERLVRTPDVLARLTREVAAGDGDAYVTATVQETPAPPSGAAQRRAAARDGGDRGRRLALPGRRLPGPQRLPASTTTRRSTPSPTPSVPSASSTRSPGTYTWIPFGGGRRRCLGAAFATVEMKIVLRAVLERARPRLAGDGRLELSRRRSITLSPREGAEVVLA